MIIFQNKGVGPQAAPVVEPAPVPGEARPPAPKVPEESAWRVLPLSGLFELAYLDASGRSSLRRVRAAEIKVGPGKLLLGGVDEGLESYRGFRADRILSLRALESGEIVERNILDWLLERALREGRAAQAAAKPKRKREARPA